jgi:hypothetical protein
MPDHKNFDYHRYVLPNVYRNFKNLDQANKDLVVQDRINPLRKKLEGIDGILPTYHLKTNSFGYRSDEFTKTHDGKHILFAGCSETFGQGGELSDVWARRLYCSIEKNEKVSGYYNIGRCGVGMQEIFSLLTDYIDQFGKPDVLFLLFPNMSRFISHFNIDNDGIDASGFYAVSFIGNIATITGSGLDLNLGDDCRYGQNAIMDMHAHFLLYIKLVETFCRESSIELFWSTWHTDNFIDNKFKNGNFKYRNYVDLNVSEEDLYEEINKDKSLTIKKADNHYGTAYHKIWADRFHHSYLSRRS